MCDEGRIGAVFAGTRGRVEGEHVVREARARFRHEKAQLKKNR